MKLSTVAAALVSLFVMFGVMALFNTPAKPVVPEALPGEPDKPKETPPYYQVSPLKFPTKAEETPKAACEDPIFNFDRMMLGNTETHRFEIHNDGQGVLQLAKGPSTCPACTIGSLEKEVTIDKVTMMVLQPGETGGVNVKWNPAAASSQYSKQVTVWTNDPERKSIHLTVEGSVVAPLDVKPTAQLLEDFRPDEAEKTFEMEAFSTVAEKFELTISSSTDRLTVKTEPLNDDELKGHDARSGYKLLGTLVATKEVGAIAESFKIHTDLPHQDDVTIPVTSKRTGPISIIGPAWTQERLMVNLGKFKATAGKEVVMSLFVLPMGIPLQLQGEPEITPAATTLKFSLEKVEEFKAPNKEQYRFKVSYPPNGPIDRAPLEASAKVILKTNHPLATTLSINVVFEAD